MGHDPYRALYIHVPFCVSRCAYCDFTTCAMEAGAPVIDEYFEQLISRIRELSRAGELAHIETVYIGGGTPTHAGAKNLASLLYALGVSMHLSPEVECSVEANPESLTERLVNDMWALGANRLSIGVQSFDDDVLRTLGRAHDGKDAHRAIAIAQGRFNNVSIDLMCGVPGQTPKSFEQDVRTAIDLGVAHISIYPLTIEEHTLFARMVRAGQLEEPDEDVQADMMEASARLLRQAGYERYEVASYAREGYQSRHNTAYWSGVPYVGVGTSATTMTQNAQRRMRVQDGQVVDDLDAVEMAAEDMMLAMRMARGVSFAEVERAALLLPRLNAVLDRACAQGLIVREDGRFKPTEWGWLCGNELYGALLDSATL